MMENAVLSGSARHTPSKEEIEEKSAQLLVKLIHCPDAATREEVYRWIEERPANAVAFAEAEAAWEAAERLKADCIEATEAISAPNTSKGSAALAQPPAPGHIRGDDRRVTMRAGRRGVDRPD